MLTVHEAARLVGVPVETIRTWQKRGVLKPALRHPRLGYLYFYAEVLAAEKVTRNADPTRREP
jgi:excisionase family DNA binding protein